MCLRRSGWRIRTGRPLASYPRLPERKPGTGVGFRKTRGMLASPRFAGYFGGSRPKVTVDSAPNFL